MFVLWSCQNITCSLNASRSIRDAIKDQAAQIQSANTNLQGHEITHPTNKVFEECW